MIRNPQTCRHYRWEFNTRLTTRHTPPPYSLHRSAPTITTNTVFHFQDVWPPIHLSRFFVSNQTELQTVQRTVIVIKQLRVMRHFVFSANLSSCPAGRIMDGNGTYLLCGLVLPEIISHDGLCHRFLRELYQVSCYDLAFKPQQW